MDAAFKITVSPYQCDKRFAGWVRTNRNNRIAKKWRKKYGARMKCQQQQVFRLGGMLICCPHQFEVVVSQTKKQVADVIPNAQGEYRERK